MPKPPSGKRSGKSRGQKKPPMNERVLKSPMAVSVRNSMKLHRREPPMIKPALNKSLGSITFRLENDMKIYILKTLWNKCVKSFFVFIKTLRQL